MTSEQECPLCGNDLYYAMELGFLRCMARNCCLYTIELRRLKFRCLASQISRIKQEAYEKGKEIGVKRAISEYFTCNCEECLHEQRDCLCKNCISHREKNSKIAELNTENFNLKDWIKQYDNQAKEYRSRIAKLEKENKGLKLANEVYTETIEDYRWKVKDQEEQNSKLADELENTPGLECDCDGSGQCDGHELMCPMDKFRRIIKRLRGEKD